MFSFGSKNVLNWPCLPNHLSCQNQNRIYNSMPYSIVLMLSRVRFKSLLMLMAKFLRIVKIPWNITCCSEKTKPRCVSCQLRKLSPCCPRHSQSCTTQTCNIKCKEDNTLTAYTDAPRLTTDLRSTTASLIDVVVKRKYFTHYTATVQWETSKM